MNTREVYGYLRVSGKGQADGDGFPRQREAIEKFCAERGWTIKRFFQEAPSSGTIEAEDRPVFSEMLSLCGGALPLTVVVERADRLARDLIVSELLFRECKEQGIEVFGADSGEELVNATGDPTRVLIRQMLGALAQWEKSALVKKLRAARDRKRVATGRCEGAKPYSATHPEEYQKAINWIRFARESGSSYRQVAAQLNSAKFPAPGGNIWFPSTVFTLFKASPFWGVDKSPGVCNLS